jgi:hypothetical protein
MLKAPEGLNISSKVIRKNFEAPLGALPGNAFAIVFRGLAEMIRLRSSQETFHPTAIVLYFYPFL